jgi:hypothetical protein
MDGRDCSNDDFNNDGIPDCWEIAYFGSIYAYGPNSDPDRDRLNNLQEYLLGSDPTIANTSAIGLASPIAQSDGTFIFSSVGVINRRYRVQGSATLKADSWVDITNFLQTVPVQSIVVTPDATEPFWFYRTVYP